MRCIGKKIRESLFYIISGRPFSKIFKLGRYSFRRISVRGNNGSLGYVYTYYRDTQRAIKLIETVDK